MPSAAHRLSKLKISARRAPVDVALEPVPDLDEVAAALTLFRVDVSQVASNRVFQNGQQEFLLALDRVIAPDQVGVLSRQHEPRVDCFFR